ncbi:MAG TPA: FAD-binding protein [Pseudonocardiaceae bacterium]|jgi:xylitol oxidase
MTTNWAGNIIYCATEIHCPSSFAQVQELVARSNRVRALGTRHSFSDLADSPGVLISLSHLPSVAEIDAAASTATVAAGMRYVELARHLDGAGFALPNLASLPHISVAGGCATATHGSGWCNGNLATHVSQVDLVTANGDLVTVGRNDHDGGDRFNGVVVGLGALGVVVSLTLDLVPAFEVRQHVYHDLPLQALEGHFTELVSCAHSVSLFTDWGASRLTQIWIKQRTDQPEPAILDTPWFTAQPADGPRHPVPGMNPVACTAQLGVAGRWFERLPHFRPDCTPSAGEELQSEYLIPQEHAIPALRALDRVREKIHPVLQICEVRTITADELWLSPCYRQHSVSIHFTWIADTAAVLPAVALVEAQLAPFGARPHWGKIFTSSPKMLYERLPDFRDLVRELDPTGKFGNAFTRRHLALHA